MGLEKLLGLGAKPKSTASMVAAQEAAAKQEKEKLAQDQAIAEANTDSLSAGQRKRVSRRMSLTNAFSPVNQDPSRRRYLQGA